MIRLVEIPQAIAKGVRKEYGEYHGLSVVTFENFISSYLKSPERIEMGKEIARLNEPKEPTLDEKFNVAKFVTLEALQCVKGGRVITLPGVTVYDFLERLKLIVFSVPEKREFVEEAKRELKREKEYLKSVELDKVKRRSIERFLDALQAGGEKGLVVSRAKRIAVNEYLRQVVLEGVDLELEIEERRADFIRARI